jgi:hypothetical protein
MEELCREFEHVFRLWLGAETEKKAFALQDEMELIRKEIATLQKEASAQQNGQLSLFHAQNFTLQKRRQAAMTTRDYDSNLPVPRKRCFRLTL